MTASTSNDEFDGMPPAMSLATLGLTLLAVTVGAFAAAVALPRFLPGLSASLLGPAPKAYWYLSRASAFVAYGLLWLSMVFGVMITNKMARAWPGGPVAFDLHQHASLLGLAFGLFHALILMGDKYIQYSAFDVLVPFASTSYRPLWVGLGQISLYLLALVGLSFYVRGRIGNRLWRLIHFLSFAVFALALIHGLWSGTDTPAHWASAVYWITGGALLLLTVFRITVRWVAASPRRAAPAPAPNRAIGPAIGD